MQRERPVCAACGARFELDDFTEDLGELVACPYCGSVDIELAPEEAAAETEQDEAAAEKERDEAA